MTLPSQQIKEGVIFTKMESWHGAGSNALTKNWTTINNKGRQNLRMNSTSNTTSSSSFAEDCELSERRLRRKSNHHRQHATISNFSISLMA
jgi:hypothetical protein